MTGLAEDQRLTLCRTLGIVRENFGVDPDLSDSSPLVKGAKRLYELVKKKKNARQSKETVIKCEEAILKAFEIELGSAVMKNYDETRGTPKAPSRSPTRMSRLPTRSTSVEYLWKGFTETFSQEGYGRVTLCYTMK